MSQKKTKNRFMQMTDLRKPLCAVMILCSWLIVTPQAVRAAGDVATSQAVNQQITVKGTVVDVNGEPVIGASVKVEGGNTGTITDIDGNFSIAVSAKAKLVISFVGYKSQVVIPKTGQLKIVLQEDSELLEEVVVVGYGTVKRANLTGAVSSVKMSELADIPATNLTSVLMGTMPGVTVGEATGNPLANASIRIRISGSWNVEDPLYIIDGFIRDVNAFNLLDPSEIKDFSVLKDAQAAAYGVRGAGGVILVTTKRGMEGKTRISYSGSYGFSQSGYMPEMMSAYEQGMALNDMYREQLINGETGKYLFTDEELSQIKNLDYNWLDMGWKNAQNTRHTINVSGGSEKVKYFVGGSYIWSDGNFKNMGINRFNVRSGIDMVFSKSLKGNVDMNFSSRDTNMPLNEKDAEADRMYGTFDNLNRMPRWVAPYVDGLPVGNGMADSDTHPLEIFNSGSYKRSKSMDFSLGAKLDYTFKWVKGLKANLQFNYSRNASHGKQLSKPYKVYTFQTNQILNSDGKSGSGHLIDPANTVVKTKSITNGDKLYESADFGYSYQLNPSLSYNRTIGKHDVNAVFVFEQSEGGGNGLNTSRSKLIYDGVETMTGYDNDPKGYSNGSFIRTLSRRLSYIGRLNYTYNGRYNLEAMARYESSASFPPGRKWGLFPSIAAGWRVSEEKWFKENVSFMDNLKIRVNYGRLGSDKVSISQWSQSYANAGVKYLLGTSGASVNSLTANMAGLIIRDITWEKTDSYNAGIDMRFLDCLSVNVDGFYRNTFDILDEGKSLFPQSAGISGVTPKMNFGKQKAWGGELEIAYNKQLNKDLGVNVKGNFAWATNQVVRKNQNPGIIGTWRDENGRIRGGEVGYLVWRGADGKGDGLARSWQDIYDYISYLKGNLKDGKGEIEVLGLKEQQLRPGMIMYQDLGTSLTDKTPDGKISASSETNGDDCIISKYDSAPFNYGFSLGFSWKGLKVDALFSGQFGNDVVFDKGFYETASGGKRSGEFLSVNSNQLKEWYGNYAVADPETKELKNPDCIYPRLDKESLRNIRSDFWMRDGHMLRLRTLNVSYSLPSMYTKKLGMESVRVFFTGTNLWTLVNPFPYKDAYVSYWTDYPQIRSFNFGINISL